MGRPSLVHGTIHTAGGQARQRAGQGAIAPLPADGNHVAGRSQFFDTPGQIGDIREKFIIGALTTDTGIGDSVGRRGGSLGDAGS